MKHGRDLQSYLKLGDRKQDFFREEFLFESCQGFEKKIICKIILQYGFYILPCYAFRNVLEKRKAHMHAVSLDSCFWIVWIQPKEKWGK